MGNYVKVKVGTIGVRPEGGPAYIPAEYTYFIDESKAIEKVEELNAQPLEDRVVKTPGDGGIPQHIADGFPHGWNFMHAFPEKARGWCIFMVCPKTNKDQIWHDTLDK